MTPDLTWQIAGRTRQQASCGGGGEGGGGHQLKVIDIRWAHQLLGELQRGHIPHGLFNKLQVEML